MNPALTTQRSSLTRAIFTTDHHILGVRYLLLSLAAVAVGTIMSLAMRLHLIWPDRTFLFSAPSSPRTTWPSSPCTAL